MRRKNLMFTAGLILLLVFLHSAGIPLKQSVLTEFARENAGTGVLMSGKVTGIQTGDNGVYRLKVRLQNVAGEEISPGETILLRYEDVTDPPWMLIRRTISFSGTLESPQGRRNPGCFDYQLYLKSQGIFYQARADVIHAEEEMSGVLDRAAAWLIKMRFRFMDTLSETSKGLVSGVLFGDTSYLEEEVYEEFRNNGTAHVLAVSGLHVGILYGIYRRIFGNSQSPAAAASLVLMLAVYGTVSMWSPSVLRASMMIGLHVLAQALDLRYDMATGLSTVALVLILQNPYVIFSSGFQMSFLAIASICFLVPVMPRKIPDAIAASLAVNMGLLVYQMFQFNYISLVALAANIPVIYLAGILVPAALLGFLAFIVTGGMGPLSVVLDGLSFLTVRLNRFSTLGGYGSMDVISPPLWLVLAFYFLLFFFVSEQNLIFRARRRSRVLVLILTSGLVICVILSGLFFSPVSTADLVFVDVGQGDCIHIRDGSRNILIDGGGAINYNTGKNILKPYLLKNGVWNVDLALATHLHTDHYKGLEELAEVYPVKQLRSGMTAGDSVQVSENIRIETLWPLTIDSEMGQEENADCSVFMIHYEGRRVLITGDLNAEGEQEMVQYYRQKGELSKLKADILKVGHHGSQTSTCDIFLDAVNPQIAVFQVGAYNNYGHPDQKIVEKCQKRGIMVKRNDYNGGIGFSFRKDDICVSTVIS